LFTAFVPLEETLHGAFVATNGAPGPIAGSQFIKLEGKNFLGKRRSERGRCHVFSPVSVFSPVFLGR
jgi:hypothetical protein